MDSMMDFRLVEGHQRCADTDQRASCFGRPASAIVGRLPAAMPNERSRLRAAGHDRSWAAVRSRLPTQRRRL